MFEFVGLAVAIVFGYTVLILVVGVIVRFFQEDHEAKDSINDWSPAPQASGPSLAIPAALPATDDDMIPVAVQAEAPTSKVGSADGTNLGEHKTGNDPVADYYSAPKQDVEMSYRNLSTKGYPPIGMWKALLLACGTLITVFIVGMFLGLVAGVLLLVLGAGFALGMTENLVLSFVVFCPVATFIRLMVMKGGFGPTLIAVFVETVLLYAGLAIYGWSIAY